jgi:hypothetical protein
MDLSASTCGRVGLASRPFLERRHESIQWFSAKLAASRRRWIGYANRLCNRLLLEQRHRKPLQNKVAEGARFELARPLRTHDFTEFTCYQTPKTPLTPLDIMRYCYASRRKDEHE